MLTLGTAKITETDGLVILEFMRHGSFTIGRQTFGNSRQGYQAALRFCRERDLRVLT